MGLSFGPEAPVLRFRQRGVAPRRKRRRLLWPVWCYRVVAPRPRERQLNILQRAVLGLRRAGVPDARSSGGWLHIDPMICGHILEELRDEGLLDDGMQLTVAGDVALTADSTLQSHDIVVGHVFQSIWTGKLWPRFVEELGFVDVQWTRGGPRLYLGTAGAPRYDSPTVVASECGSGPSPIDAHDVLEACRIHHRALWTLQNEVGVEPEDDSEHGALEAHHSRIRSVSLIDELPRAMYLLTQVNSVPIEAGTTGWDVVDPFGVAGGGFFRAELERQVGRDPSLVDVLEDVMGTSLQESTARVEAWRAELREKARLSLLRYWGPDCQRVPYLERVRAMQAKRLAAEQCESFQLEEERRDLLLSARRVLEAIVEHAMSRFDPGTAHRQCRDGMTQDELARLYGDAYRAIGGVGGLPRPLSTIGYKKLRGTRAGQRFQLTPALAAMILSAAVNLKHPLRRALEREPNLVCRLSELIEFMGEGAHHGKNVASIAQCLEIVEGMMETVSLFEDLPIPPRAALHGGGAL